MGKTNFKKDFDEYLELNPDFYRYYSDSSYFELADWYTAKYAKEICTERNICEAYEFAKWVVDGLEHTSSSNPSTRDHVVKIRERYEGKIDFEKWHDCLDDDIYKAACEMVGIDPTHFKYEEESCADRMPQVDYDLLRVGDLLWYNDIGKGIDEWCEVVITHIHGGVVFLRKTQGSDMEEFWLPKKSLGYYLGLYPKKVVIPKGCSCECNCPYTKFIEED